MKDIEYCRSCYDHLAGFAGVTITEALEAKGVLKKSEKDYLITEKGWNVFLELGINKNNFTSGHRPLTRQCLDGTERSPHLAGQLGAEMLRQMLKRKWFIRKENSRVLKITLKGRRELKELLGLKLE